MLFPLAVSGQEQSTAGRKRGEAAVEIGAAQVAQVSQSQWPEAGSSQETNDDGAQTASEWHYGGFADAAYLPDFNDPPNHLFRDRSTAFRVNEVDLNMAAVYVKKDATEKSRWGMEGTLQGGRDAEGFGFSATAPNVNGSTWLRHFGPTDISCLVPIGKGLTIQAGLFSSSIGYDRSTRKIISAIRGRGGRTIRHT